MSCLRSTVQCCLHCLVTDNFRSWAVEPREDASDRGYYRSLRDNDDGSDGSLEPDLVLDGASLTVEDRTFAEGGYCTGIYRGFFRSTAGTSESSTSSVSSRSGRVGVVRKDDDEKEGREGLVVAVKRMEAGDEAEHEVRMLANLSRMARSHSGHLQHSEQEAQMRDSLHPLEHLATFHGFIKEAPSALGLVFDL